MTQGERTATIKKTLKWLNAQTESVSVMRFLYEIEVNITEMGATRRTSRNYIDALRDANLISVSGLKFKVSEDGKKWLASHQ